jgi:hypothetical protein
MSRPERLTGGVGAPFHPVSHYGSPADVLNDQALSPGEKRVILSSWASDIYAVDSRPALREIPGVAVPMRLSDILGALRRLDVEESGSCGDAAAMRIAGQRQSAARSRLPRIAIPARRLSREANVQRYRKLLKTQLTDHERRYVEQRLAEELGSAGSTIETPKVAATAYGMGSIAD